MRTLVDLPERDIEALDRIAQDREVSRAKIIRLAVKEYLARAAPIEAEAAFGIWATRSEDGLAYQRRLRSEW